VSEKEHSLRVQRVLLALDPSSSDASVLAAAAELAFRFQAELLGLFIEDADLFRLTGASSVRTVDALLAVDCDLDGGKIERLLRVRARRVQKSLLEAAERLEVTASLRVTRGKVVPEVLAAAEEADVLVVRRNSWALVKTRRLSPAVRDVLSGSKIPTLLLHAKSRLSLPVSVVYDGGPTADRALDAAADLAEKDDGRLAILVLGDGMKRAADLRSRVEEQLGERALKIRYRLLTESNVPRLVSILRTAGGGTMVLPAKSAILQDEALLELLDKMDVPVLLVR